MTDHRSRLRVALRLLLALALAPALTPPAHAAVAGQWRYAIGTYAAFPDFSLTARRMDYVVLHGWQQDRLHALKAANPAIKVLLYKNLSASQESSAGGLWATGVSYQEADSEHPEWFLRNRVGDRFTFAGYPFLWAMDVGNPDYQQRWIENVLRDVTSDVWDGVLIDDANPTMKYHYDPSQIANHPTDAHWQQATESALATIGPQLQAAGKLAIPNIGSWSEDGYTAVGDRWLRYVSGAMQEHFVKWGTTGTGYADPVRWRRALSSLQAAQRAGKVFIGLTTSDDTDAQAARYGWATTLLGAEGAASFTMQSAQDTEPWFPEYDYEIGAPLEAARADLDGIHWRRFSSGLVVVNPTTTSRSVKLGGTYSGSGYKRAQRITLRPNTAAVMVADGR